MPTPSHAAITVDLVDQTAPILDRANALSVGVLNVAPIATFTNGGAVAEGSTGTVSFSSQFDPSSADTTAGFRYSYDFDNDGTFEITDSASASGHRARPAYLADGPGTPDRPRPHRRQGRRLHRLHHHHHRQQRGPDGDARPTAARSTEGSTGDRDRSASQFDPSAADTAAGFRYSYDFDNDGTFEIAGSTSASATVPASYLDDGPATRTVRGRIADDDGGFTDYTTAITVNNVAPTATFSAPGSVPEGTSIGLALSSPLDPSSADTTAGFTYAFDCDDGLGYGAFSASATASCPTNDNGSRTVRGKIRDDDGGETEYTASVVIGSVAPSATFGNNGPVDEGSPATLSLTSPIDPSSADTTAGFHYSFACDGLISSLEGNYAFASSSNTYPCTFADDGSFGVAGSIIDKDNASSTYGGSVVVNNVAPAIIEPDEQDAFEGTPTTFDLGFFTDPGADGPWTVTIAWGDGSSNDSFTMLTPGEITDTAHTYADNGLYLVTLTVEEEPGDGSAPLDTDTFQILVDNVQPQVAAGDDATTDEGLDTSFGLGSFTDPGDDDPWTVNVDWGDGSTDD